MRYFIGDTETTGVGPKARVCDIAFLEIDPGTLNMRSAHASLIDPEIPIPAEASAIHGISDEDVATAPTMEEFISRVLFERIEEPCVLIAHNVKFDAPFFAPVMNVADQLCTLMMARELLPTGLENHKLGTLAAHYGLPAGQAHRAMGDVLTVWALLRELLKASGRTLLEYMDIPVHEIFVMPFGMHAGKQLMDIPAQYRTYLLTKDIDANLRYSLMRLREAGI